MRDAIGWGRCPQKASRSSATAISPIVVVFIGIFIYSCLFTVALRAQDPMQLPKKDLNYKVQPYQGGLEKDDFQWVRAAKDYRSTRYSTLSEINQGNIKNLKLSFTFSTGLERGHEAAPLVVNNTM